MKLVFSLVMAFFISLSAVEPAEAKRFGSGGFGKAFKTSPFNKATPQKAIPGKATNPAAGRKPGMGGLMGGLLAGGIFAYLLGSGAFEGIQFMDLLLFGLVGFVLFKLFAGRKLAAAGAHQQGAYGQKADYQAFQSNNNAMSSDAEESQMSLPEGFDVLGFTERALDHYKLVHKAWDQGDMLTVKEYLADNLFDQLDQERKEYTAVLNNSILDLSADIVRSEAIIDGHIVSILFRGRMKDVINNQEQGIYDVWHLQQTNNGAWTIIGIEAE